MRLCLVALVAALLAATPARAGTPKSPSYASTRLRDASGRFVPVKPYRATGWGNPSSTGQSKVNVMVHPATRTAPGSLRVEIPDYYRGTSFKGGNQARTLFVPNGKRSMGINGQLLVRPGSRYTSFSRATYTATIPAGTPVPHDALKSALRSLQVNPHSLQFHPANQKK